MNDIKLLLLCFFFSFSKDEGKGSENYSLKVPEVNISVMKLMALFSTSIQEA